MNEERASEGPPRRSGGSGGAFSRGEGTRRAGRGGTGRGGAGHEGPARGSGAQWEWDQVAAAVPVARGGRRRVAAQAPLDSGDLAQALQRSVAAIGTAGPPRAGLTRIRRRAKARQRRRTVMAGGAGVLFVAMAVSVLTGKSFDIVPVLTGVVGLGGGDGDGGGATSSSPSAAADGPGQVRTVRPTGGLKGPAIGPGVVAATPSALAASGVGACGATDLTTVASVDTVIGGVSYGHVEAVAAHTCAVAGPPVLQVENAAANAASSVVILRHTPSDGSQLPRVPTWGTVLVLHEGQGYDFQFAWAPDTCPAAASSAGPTGGSGGSSGGGSGAGPASGGPSAVTGTAAGSANAGDYQLSYLVTATSPTSPVTLQAVCGATVYVTDVYARGAYPLPEPDAATPTPPPSSASAAPSSAAPSPPPSTTASAPAPSSAAPSTGTGGGVSPGAPAASPAIGTPTAGASTGQAAGP